MTRQVPVTALPAEVTAPGSTLQAWERDDGAGYVLLVEAPDGSLREEEYTTQLRRLLTREERWAALPADGPYPLPDFPELSAWARHRLDERTGARILEVDVTDRTGACVSALRSLVHSTVGPQVEATIRRALDHRRFPETYRRWPDAERIAHWAYQIHRWRRARGESGQAEDTIFTPDLLADMHAVDPDVDRLLPDILAFVAALGGDPELAHRSPWPGSFRT